MSKYNQPQLHRTVGGTRSGRRLLASATAMAAATLAVTAGDVVSINKDGSYKKAQRKGVNNPPEVIKDDNGRRVVYFNKETVKQIQSLQQGKRPHIGSKQQLRQVKQALRNNPKCGCSLKQIWPDCEIHKILIQVKDESQSEVVSGVLPKEQVSTESQG